MSKMPEKVNETAAAPAPAIDPIAMLLAAQAENSRLQIRLLEREEKKDEAIARKEEALAARIEKERKQLLEQMQIRLDNDQARWTNCPHVDQRGGSRIYPISNHPDRRLRGICIGCGCYIEPAHYETD